MSIFASRTTKTIDIPFDPPHTVTIQQLPGRHFYKAAKVNLATIFADVAERGGAKVQKEMQELFKDGNTKKEIEAEADELNADPLNGYDEKTLVLHGLKAWSYDVPLTEAAIDDLHADAQEFIAREVLRLTKPALFQTKEEAAVAQKND